jgi:hypothetical protein
MTLIGFVPFKVFFLAGATQCLMSRAMVLKEDTAEGQINNPL